MGSDVVAFLAICYYLDQLYVVVSVANISGNVVLQSYKVEHMPVNLEKQASDVSMFSIELEKPTTSIASAIYKMVKMPVATD